MATKKRLFCDTNFLLDVFDSEREHHGDAVALLWYSVENPGLTELIASITSFKDAYYILARLYRSEVQARDSVRGLMDAYVHPVDMLAAYGAEALRIDEPDFEDALIVVCAQREGATTIISRDEKAFAHCGLPKLTAADFLEREGFDYEEIEL